VIDFPTDQWCCVVANQTMVGTYPITSSSRSTPHNQNFPTNNITSPTSFTNTSSALQNFLPPEIAFWSIAIATIAVCVVARHTLRSGTLLTSYVIVMYVLNASKLNARCDLLGVHGPNTVGPKNLLIFCLNK